MPKTVLYASYRATSRQISDQLAMANKLGFAIDEVVEEDTRTSNLNLPFDKREIGKRLFDLLRDGDVLICHWVDRFGRNFDEIQKNISLCLDKGITVKTVIGGVIFDAHPKSEESKHIRDALLSFMLAMAKSQLLEWKEAQAAGIARAKTSRKLAYRGRKPSYNGKQVARIMEMFGNGVGVNQIARDVGLNKFAVSRITRDHVGALAKLAKWEDQGASVKTDEEGIPNLEKWVAKYSRSYNWMDKIANERPR